MGRHPRGAGQDRARLTVLLVAILSVGLFVAPALALDTPPPTPVPPRGSPSPFTTDLHTVENATKPPPLQAKEALLMDADTGQVLFARRADERRPIASLTKVMTALLVLEAGGLKQKVTISANAQRAAALGLSSLGLKAGEQLTVEDLLWGLLLESANDAAVALAEHTGGSVKNFVKKMNDRASELGMKDTHFASPNGLNDKGYSTAADMAIVTREAMAQPLFAKMVHTKFHTVPGKPPRHIQNRNVLLWLYPGADGVKTGFTTAAGYNVIATATRAGRDLLAIVLGSPHEPFSDAAELLNYGAKGFASKRVVAAGQPFGERTIGGQRVAVAAQDDFTALVPAKGTSDIKVHPVMGDAATAEIGDTVGRVEVSRDGELVGKVPLVIATVIAAPPAPSGTWWSRSVGSVGRAFGEAWNAIFG